MLIIANVFGLCSKFGELQNVLRTSHADIAVITETKLTQQKMSLTESAIDGFHAPLRLDRTGQGGGVAVWIKEDLAYEHLSAIDCGPHEIIWLSIKLKSKEKLVIGALYRPGSLSGHDVSLLEYLDNQLDTVRRHGSNILLAGDFNVHSASWLGSTKTTPAGEYTEELCTVHGLQQHVHCATRGSNALDLVLSDLGDIVSVRPMNPIGNSDHISLLISIRTDPYRERRHCRQVWRYGKADWERLRAFPRRRPLAQNSQQQPRESLRRSNKTRAKVGDLNMHAKAVRKRTATTGTHTPDTIDHDPLTPPMTNNSTAVGEPTPFPPSNHDHIPAVQRLGLDSDSATGPQPTYADRASFPLSAPRPGKVSSTALAAAAHASHGPIPQSSRAQAPVGTERPHSRSSTGQPVAVGHLRRGVQPLESDDEDDLWTLVSKSEPTGKKAAIYVGNLDDSACEEKLCNFIHRRSKKAGIKSPKIHSCSILRREEGELGSWGAHIVIDLLSLDYICNGNFWPGRIYARPWVFRKKTAPETET